MVVGYVSTLSAPRHVDRLRQGGPNEPPPIEPLSHRHLAPTIPGSWASGFSSHSFSVYALGLTTARLRMAPHSRMRVDLPTCLPGEPRIHPLPVRAQTLGAVGAVSLLVFATKPMLGLFIDAQDTSLLSLAGTFARVASLQIWPMVTYYTLRQCVPPRGGHAPG